MWCQVSTDYPTKALLCCWIAVGQEAHQLWANATHRRNSLAPLWDQGRCRLPETNIAPENRSSQKERIVFQASICRCENVSFREGNSTYGNTKWGVGEMDQIHTCRISSLKGAAISSANTFREVWTFRVGLGFNWYWKQDVYQPHGLKSAHKMSGCFQVQEHHT